MKILIKNVNVVTDKEIIENGYCSIDNGVISKVGRNAIDGQFDQVIDGENGYLFPGFIDLHCHGGNNLDFMDASPEQIKEIADYHLSHGTTTMLATTLAAGWEETISSLENYATYKKANPEGSLFGVHLEGPWLSPLQCGAQNSEHMRIPKVEELTELKEKYPFILRISAAPELDKNGEFGRAGDKLNIVMSAAHTDATFDETVFAFENGYRLLTHFYSGMKGVTRKNAFRIGGAVEAGYYLDDMKVEIIADGCHLPKELLKLIYKIKGANNIALITDAVRAAGLPDGSVSVIGSLKNGLPIVVEKGVAFLEDRQAFAGSTATYDRLFRVMAEVVENDYVNLAKMCSKTPADILGLTDRGEIKEGKRADLVLMDKNNRLQSVFYKGEKV